MQVILTEEEYNELKQNRKEKSEESQAIKDIDRLMKKSLIGLEPSMNGLDKMVVLKIPENQMPERMLRMVNVRMNQR